MWNLKIVVEESMLRRLITLYVLNSHTDKGWGTRIDNQCIGEFYSPFYSVYLRFEWFCTRDWSFFSVIWFFGVSMCVPNL